MALPADLYNGKWRFKVTIDEVEAGDFNEVQGLTVQREVVEYAQGGENEFTRKLVGPTRFTNIVLRRGSSDSLDLWNWIKECIDGTIKRKNGSIIALNQAGDPVARWDFKEAWPCRYEGPDFDSREPGLAALAIETLELAHHGFEMVKG
ncbi:MAG: phage tail protein [Planctomycetota bacterium]|nr:MAG: phage tail protein [Planctomycetota bacterium]